jgi:hypothetical protein
MALRPYEEADLTLPVRRLHGFAFAAAAATSKREKRGLVPFHPRGWLRRRAEATENWGGRTHPCLGRVSGIPTEVAGSGRCLAGALANEGARRGRGFVGAFAMEVAVPRRGFTGGLSSGGAREGRRRRGC